MTHWERSAPAAGAQRRLTGPSRRMLVSPCNPGCDCYHFGPARECGSRASECLPRSPADRRAVRVPRVLRWSLYCSGLAAEEPLTVTLGFARACCQSRSPGPPALTGNRRRASRAGRTRTAAIPRCSAEESELPCIGTRRTSTSSRPCRRTGFPATQPDRGFPRRTVCSWLGHTLEFPDPSSSAFGNAPPGANLV